MTILPYLSTSERIDYLVNKGYCSREDVPDGFDSFLETINFHHFLGYARNLGRLAGSGLISGGATLARVQTVMLLDQSLARAVFGALQAFERQLRALFVEHHCSVYSAYDCFLEDGHYLLTTVDGKTPALDIVDHTLRMGEPYVVERLDRFRAQNSIPSNVKTRDLSNEHRRSMVAQLPIWAIVDGWSLGLLARVLVTSAPSGDAEEITYLYKKVAASSGVANTVFQTNLAAIVTLRNQVAHHSRLWMKPTTNSAKLPKQHGKAGRGAHPKSVWVTCMALEAMLNDKEAKDLLRAEISQMMNLDQAFKLGIFDLPSLPRQE